MTAPATATATDVGTARDDVDVMLPPARRLDAVLMGFIGAVIAGFGFWIPNFWTDEEATINAIDRPIDGLFRMVTTQVDAVHAVYYVLMEPWSIVLAIDPALIRLSSVVLIGFAVAGTVVLGQRLAGRWAGVFAGLVLALLPAVTDMAIEARSYPWSVAVAVWLTIVLVHALHDGRKRWWIGYALVASLLIALFLNSIVVLAAHGITVLLYRRGLRTVVSFIAAGAVGALLASPVVLLSVSQRSQVGWIQDPGWHTIRQVVVEQWFRDAVGFAVVAWLVVTVVIVVGLTRVTRLRPLLVVTVPWLIVPSTLLVGASFAFPLYTPRYLATGTPALALLIGTGISLIPWRAVRVAAVVGLAALTAGTYVGQRQPLRYSTEWREAATILEERYQPGDALLFNDEAYGPSQWTRGTLTIYGDRLSEYDDIALLESHLTNGRLRDDLVDPATLDARLAEADGVWIVWPESLGWDDSPIETALVNAGLQQTDTVTLEHTVLRYFDR
ncbi:glycosyltransferase family 39 protein [Labedella endophytica]|uniref:Glycosyltransferase RgtA/B/C/D-like domain-containing protein n=1 Tax=Labedella endophytica TaxID=1523160 RepID=A0A433JUV0_9MICO|nr:hypothetical protein [Labedella endophytica]RUR01921.1 hypothetical protein ELQ94_10800 [Labedella endophytica]